MAWAIERMYHTVINATDLDRTVDFYKALGFEVLNDRRDVKWPEFVGRIFGLNKAQGRGVLWTCPLDLAWSAGLEAAMRDDMSKVVTERPRQGHGNTSNRTTGRRVEGM